MKEAENFQSSYIVGCVFNAFLSSTAIMLNIITMLALRKTSSFIPKPLKILLLSLAVSDLGVGLLVQPLYIARLVMKMEQNTENNPIYNDTVRNAFKYTFSLFSFASFCGVVALSADRFLAIHLHLRYQELVTHKRVVGVVISIWVFSSFLSLTCFGWAPVSVKYGIFATVKAICVITTALFYWKIYLAVRRHANQIQALQVQQAAQNGETLSHLARLRKSAIGTFYVYLVFLACYLPKICILVAKISSGKTSLTSYLSLYANTLVLLNSSLNPLIYSWKMRHIRHAIMDILRNIQSKLSLN